MRREPTRSLHNLLHRPEELLHGKPSELLAIHAKPKVGEKDRAFQLLETAYAEHNPRLVSLRENVVFDNPRDDPRFADLLRRIGLPPV
jgi:hypothetical protein